MQEMRPSTEPGSGQSIILGMGTGRCGTHTLAELLNHQPDASFTHEQPPLLPWHRARGAPGIKERLQRLRRTRPQRFVGDVALFYLPYVEEAIAVEPAIRIIGLERPREEVVASFAKWGDTVHPLPTDHWAVEPAPGWHHDPVWTRIFPQNTPSPRHARTASVATGTSTTPAPPTWPGSSRRTSGSSRWRP